MTLYIGHSGQLKEVPCHCEATPEALIAALAEETGWNLTLAGPVTLDNNPAMLTVSFAEDSAIYAAPPQQQKEDYHVYDAEDLIYSVLNSTAETLVQNLNAEYVAFTSPGGGSLDFENGGYAFYLSNQNIWDEEMVRSRNEPLSDDSIGQMHMYPSGETIMGCRNLDLMFKRGGVHPTSGKITICDEEGTVFFQCDVSDTECVEEYDLPEADVEYFGWKNSSNFYIWLDKPLEGGKNYSISIDAGAFAADGLSSKEVSKGDWSIICLDFGLGANSHAGSSHVKLGESITQEILLGSQAQRVEIILENPEMGTVSAEQLTEDGTITFTPQKTGDFVVIYHFVLKDERSYEVVMGSTIIP